MIGRVYYRVDSIREDISGDRVCSAQIDDASTAASLKAHELGATEMGMVADEGVQRNIDVDFSRLN